MKEKKKNIRWIRQGQSAELSRSPHHKYGFTPLEVHQISEPSPLGRLFLTGFTMVELMAVLIILGLLMAVVVRNFVGQTDRARVITTKANLKILHLAVNQFKMDTGRFPNEDEGLSVLIVPPDDVVNYPTDGYLDTTDLPPDGWGRDFVYILYPESGKSFAIKSYGADGEEGGESYDTDLLSTDAN